MTHASSDKFASSQLHIYLDIYIYIYIYMYVCIYIVITEYAGDS